MKTLNAQTVSKSVFLASHPEATSHQTEDTYRPEFGFFTRGLLPVTNPFAFQLVERKFYRFEPDIREPVGETGGLEELIDFFAPDESDESNPESGNQEVLPIVVDLSGMSIIQ